MHGLLGFPESTPLSYTVLHCAGAYPGVSLWSIAAPALRSALCRSGSGVVPDQAQAWTLRMDLWHICADLEASLAASMAPARLSAELVLQPFHDSCAEATACAQSLASASPPYLSGHVARLIDCEQHISCGNAP